jgi:hypothetical protein
LKKFVSILLAALILYNMLGYMVVFQSYRFAIRKEVKRRIKNTVPENELIVIRLTAEDMRSGKNGYKKLDRNEFRLSDKLYDIVKRSATGDTTVFYCINDKQEEQLFANLDAHIKRQTDSNSPARQRSDLLIKNLVKQALLKQYTFQLPDAYSYAYDLANVAIPEYSLPDIPSPPPKFFF